jgi:hypothetical protein
MPDQYYPVVLYAVCNDLEVIGGFNPPLINNNAVDPNAPNQSITSVIKSQVSNNNLYHWSRQLEVDIEAALAAAFPGPTYVAQVPDLSDGSITTVRALAMNIWATLSSS